MQKIVWLVGLVTGLGLVFSIVLSDKSDQPAEPELVSIQELHRDQQDSGDNRHGESGAVVTSPEPEPSAPDAEEPEVVAGFDMTRFHEIQTETEGEEQ